MILKTSLLFLGQIRNSKLAKIGTVSYFQGWTVAHCHLMTREQWFPRSGMTDLTKKAQTVRLLLTWGSECCLGSSRPEQWSSTKSVPLKNQFEPLIFKLLNLFIFVFLLTLLSHHTLYNQPILYATLVWHIRIIDWHDFFGTVFVQRLGTFFGLVVQITRPVKPTYFSTPP